MGSVIRLLMAFRTGAWRKFEGLCEFYLGGCQTDLRTMCSRNNHRTFVRGVSEACHHSAGPLALT
jgi:hypothetical protein